MSEEYIFKESACSLSIFYDGIQGLRGNTLRNIAIEFHISCSLSKRHSVYNKNRLDKPIHHQQSLNHILNLYNLKVRLKKRLRASKTFENLVAWFLQLT